MTERPSRKGPLGVLDSYVRSYVAAPRYRHGRRLTLVTEDGVRLRAWALDGPADAPATVVVAHGLVNWSRSPRVHAFVTRLARDVHVIVPDLRGHGRSGGRCTMGRLEDLDVRAAVRAARSGLPVVTLGVSLGGAAVLVDAGKHPNTVAGVFAISAPSGWDTADGAGSLRVRRWVTGRGGRLVLAALTRTRVGGCDGPVPDAGHWVPRISPAFTVVAADRHDWYFGPEHAELLHGLAGEPRELWWYDGVGHGTDLLTPELADRVVATVRQRVVSRASRAADGEVIRR